MDSDLAGTFDERMKSQMTVVSGQPVGALSSASLAACFPYAVSQIGASIFGASDKPLVIVTKYGGTSNAGQTITYPRAALTKLPQLRLKPTDTLLRRSGIHLPGRPHRPTQYLDRLGNHRQRRIRRHHLR